MPDHTYEMAANPPAPMAWPDYERIAASELADALVSNASEAEVHAILERHPSLLPCRHALPLTGGEGSFPSAVISKPPLPSWGGKIPDFMWIASDSVTLAPVLIEIEAPGKPWFTQSGQQTHELTQALNQLADWRLWFEDAHHVATFLDFYRVDGMLKHRLWRPEYLLIYGRRADSHRTNSLAKKRGLMQSNDQNVVSFDRLVPREAGAEYMCATIHPLGYRALSVPPTITLGPLWAEHRSLMSGKEYAIDANAYLSPERKDFLKKRMSYWDQWAQLESKGTCRLGDFE